MWWTKIPQFAAHIKKERNIMINYWTKKGWINSAQQILSRLQSWSKAQAGNFQRQKHHLQINMESTMAQKILQLSTTSIISLMKCCKEQKFFGTKDLECNDLLLEKEIPIISTKNPQEEDAEI